MTQGIQKGRERRGPGLEGWTWPTPAVTALEPGATEATRQRRRAWMEVCSNGPSQVPSLRACQRWGWPVCSDRQRDTEQGLRQRKGGQGKRGRGGGSSKGHGEQGRPTAHQPRDPELPSPAHCRLPARCCPWPRLPGALQIPAGAPWERTELSPPPRVPPQARPALSGMAAV